VGKMRGNSQKIIKKNAPLWLDKIADEILKMIIGTITFFLFYFGYRAFFDFGQNLFIDIAVLTIFNIFANVAAMILSYILITKIFFKNYSARGITGYNDFQKKIYYNFVSIFLNSLCGAAMILTLLIELSSSWVMFLMFWFGYKIIVALCGFFIAINLKENALILLCFLIVFISILIIGLKMWRELNFE